MGLTELPSVQINSCDRSSSTIRLFQLTLNGVTVELSALGASVTKVLLPNYSKKTTPEDTLPVDDVVLSYASQKRQYDDKNKPFFGAIVGRVANRIKDGRFQLLHKQKEEISNGPAVETLETYQLEKNNGPNHLHGGFDGFCHKIWCANIINDQAVQFTLVSPDGDQGYPGGIQVSATYSLVHAKKDRSGGADGAKLCLKMHASLLPGETKSTPIALAQHSYFNLASHSSRRKILDHTLHLPNCAKFTPLDNTSIPTRDVQQVDDSGTKAMDFREEKLMAHALQQYGEERAGLTQGDAIRNAHRVLESHADDTEESLGTIAKTPKDGGAPGANLDGDSPYGFDHNYVVGGNVDGGSTSKEDGDSLRLAAILSHPPTGRSLRVYTTAPGMQLYTANYLDGKTPTPNMCKDGWTYYQWQGICLETQTYPDSVYPEDGDSNDEFSKGKCHILRPGGSDYFHAVEYEFCSM